MLYVKIYILYAICYNLYVICMLQAMIYVIYKILIVPNNYIALHYSPY